MQLINKASAGPRILYASSDNFMTSQLSLHANRSARRSITDIRHPVAKQDLRYGSTRRDRFSRCQSVDLSW